MKKHPTLPLHIIRMHQSPTWYINTKTGEKIHIDNLGKHCPEESTTPPQLPEVDPIKDEAIRSKRWDL